MVYRDVTYRAVVGFRPLSLDLFKPEQHGPTPVVIALHGGAFRVGSRSMYPPAFGAPEVFRRLAHDGTCVASVDYRLSGEATWPACVHDVMAAISWLRARSSELGIDPERIGLWGESAGAYLALMTALSSPTDDGLTVGALPGVRCAVAWYPPVDFSTMQAQGAPATDAAGSPESHLLGVPVGDARERARRASPVNYLSVDSVPILLMHGTADDAVPFAQSEQLVSAAAQVGAPVELSAVADYGHTFRGHRDPAGLQRTALDFLLRHL
ncbi:alpha/beta hydrolase fold domain-containing protein [Nocardioides sp.]|uniref:alpha/beta hydrolase fold domain-containing protein n=1 Tax=Nocardioides sp. TaxID=35761 RepID=UPI0039E4DA7A